MPRPVALLDVDHTLLFHGELNQTLLDALKTKGIKDIYLFTDMSLGLHSIQDRNDLIEALSRQGFMVHGVITPSDVVWQQLSIDDACDLYDKVGNREYTGNLYGEEFEAFLESNGNTLLSNKEIIELLEENQPAQAFEQAKQILACENENAPSQQGEIHIKSMMAKAIADSCASKNGYAHVKALMLWLFIHHKPDWVSSVIIADDNEEVIASIYQYKEINEAVSITAIYVEDLHMDFENYDAILNGHLGVDLNPLFDKIDSMMIELQGKEGKPTSKIKALTALKTMLMDSMGTDCSVLDIIDVWKHAEYYAGSKNKTTTNYEKISTSHRLFQPKSKRIQGFIRGLETDFGGVVLSGDEQKRIDLIHIQHTGRS